jgi:hypothetical protein
VGLKTIAGSDSIGRRSGLSEPGPIFKIGPGWNWKKQL